MRPTGNAFLGLRFGVVGFLRFVVLLSSSKANGDAMNANKKTTFLALLSA